MLGVPWWAWLLLASWPASLVVVLVCLRRQIADEDRAAACALEGGDDAEMEALRARADAEWAQDERGGFSELDVEWLRDNGVAA